jgi:hypothetical protein
MKKNKNYRIKNLLINQKGMALLTTLIFVAVLVSLAVALLTMTSNDSKLSTLQRESNNAFYLAEAGIEKALYNLNVDDYYPMLGESAWRPDSAEPYQEGITEEYFEVTITNIGDTGATPPEEETDRIKIISTGVVNKGKYSSGRRKIEVIAKIDFLLEAMYKYAILSDKVIIFQGTPGPTIDGDMHSNDDMEVNGQFADNYDGNATCTGDNNEVDSDNIDFPEQPVPTVSYTDLFNEAGTYGGTVHTDTVDLGNGDVEEWTGIHYIQGDLIAKNGSTINITNGAIIVEGNVDIRAKATFNHIIDEDNDTYNWLDSGFSHLGVIAQGDILLHAKSAVVNGIVQSVLPDGTSTGTIDLRNEATIYGSAIAQTVQLHNKCNIIYDPDATSDITTQGDGFYKKVSWQEIYD